MPRTAASGEGETKATGLFLDAFIVSEVKTDPTPLRRRTIEAILAIL